MQLYLFVHFICSVIHTPPPHFLSLSLSLSLSLQIECEKKNSNDNILLAKVSMHFYIFVRKYDR